MPLSISFFHSHSNGKHFFANGNIILTCNSTPWLHTSRERKKESKKNLYGEIITSALLSRKLLYRTLDLYSRRIVKYCKIKDVRLFSFGHWCDLFEVFERLHRIGLSLHSRYNWMNSLPDNPNVTVVIIAFLSTTRSGHMF